MGYRRHQNLRNSCYLPDYDLLPVTMGIDLDRLTAGLKPGRVSAR